MELSWNLRLTSESVSGDSEMRPVPVTDRFGEAASIWPLRSVPRKARSLVTCPTTSLFTARSLMRNLKSFRGMSKVPLPVADNSTVPDKGTPG